MLTTGVIWRNWGGGLGREASEEFKRLGGELVVSLGGGLFIFFVLLNFV